MKTPLVVAALVGFVITSGGHAAAQGGRTGRQDKALPPTAATPGETPITPAEIRRMFDSYALMQAQEQLKISDEQFPRFLKAFKGLQDIRRQTQAERGRLIQDLRRLTNDVNGDEAAMKEKVKALQDLQDRSQADVKKAYEVVDQTLDVRQQARFRVFEEVMEQRMLQLITRARQANRPKQ
jgi:hypothetical protein